jgi:HAD superfamily hydrolase (TIGR01509 family)
VNCIIFDLDGTLVETEQVWRDVRRDFVVSHGGRWHDGAQETMIGMRTQEWAAYIHDDLGVGLPQDEIARLVVDGVVAALRTNVPILPGAQAALERVSKTFRLGLATSAARPVAETVLDRANWRRFFQVVVSADDVARGKPEPDVYLRALELMRADPRSTEAIEDSTNGIRAAHAAGLRVIAVPNREFPPKPDALALAARVIPNLDALQIP